MVIYYHIITDCANIFYNEKRKLESTYVTNLVELRKRLLNTHFSISNKISHITDEGITTSEINEFNSYIDMIIKSLETDKLIQTKLTLNYDCCTIHILKSKSNKVKLTPEQYELFFYGAQDDLSFGDVQDDV